VSRQLTENQKESLRVLARIVMTQLEFRRQSRAHAAAHKAPEPVKINKSSGSGKRWQR
jgi:hypothetical protein